MSADPGAGRRLFAYLHGEEWEEYRRIMGIFAGTFFSEFTTGEVAQRLAEEGPALDDEVVAGRLERLRTWGNLTVSSATGTPTSLADYYRRRNRYLITRAGQEVHDLVEGVLTRVDEVRDISTGRLRSLLDALRALAALDPAAGDPQRLADLVEAVFDPHRTFTSEITQFFAAINQWQSRYDLSPDELSFFAQVLVRYVTERLDEIEQVSRPIARALTDLSPAIPLIVERAQGGLAAKVAEAGLGDTVAVTRAVGTAEADWAHLAGWFVDRPGRPARLDQLRRDALAAIRTLTLNLTRLSRSGIGTSSRREDLLRLAGLVAASGGDDAVRLVHAALGLHGPVHLGVRAGDADDPVPATTPWADGPAASVPVSLRERGDTANRGQASPITDRAAGRRALRERRERELEAIRRTDTELLHHERLDGAYLSPAALARLQSLVSTALARTGIRAATGEVTDAGIRCTIERRPDTDTRLVTEEGTMVLYDLAVSVSRPS